MKAYCIILEGHPYSERVGRRCIDSARDIGGIHVERFKAVDADNAVAVMHRHRLTWTWGEGVCPKTRLNMHPYGGGAARIGCAMSHFLLWKACVEAGEDFLILEHDSVFIRQMPEVDFDFICQINDPRGATRRGDWWSDLMADRGPGVFYKTWVTWKTQKIPDGLAGNSAYLLKPKAAQRLVDLYETVGVWPNDATMCEQLVPGLQELYPFVTRVEQERSTTSA